MSKQKEPNWRKERKVCSFYEQPNRCRLINSIECITYGNQFECGIYESELRSGHPNINVKELTRLERFYVRHPGWTLKVMKICEGFRKQ